MSTETTASPTQTTTFPISSATSSQYNSWGSGSGPSQPSSILFFIAVAIGVLIALVFVFFSIRYYVRSKLGIFATARITTLENGVIIVSNDYPSHTLNAYTPDAFDVVRAQRRRRRKYLKKRRLTEEELDHLFPVRLYQDWLDGGAEIDAHKRNIAAQLKEENDDDVREDHAQQQAAEAYESQEATVTHDAVSSSSSSNEQHAKENVDLSNPFQEELHFDSGTCAICIDTFEPEDLVRGLICGHVFHKECLDPWLTKRKACCPMCKRDYYMKNNATSEDIQGADDGGDGNSILIPEIHYTTVSERVTEVLSAHPEYQAQAEERIKRRMSRPYRILWKIMGISVHDLLNSAILEIDYENNFREGLPQDTTAGETTEEPAGSDPSNLNSAPNSSPLSNDNTIINPVPSADVRITHANIVESHSSDSSDEHADRTRASNSMV